MAVRKKIVRWIVRCVIGLLIVIPWVLADAATFPLPTEKVDPSTVAVTNEFRSGWWSRPYHERYRILVDFDFDGHDDMLLSEPLANFGTGGGSWCVYHWTNGTYQAIGDVGMHYAAWSFDRCDETGRLRLWTYWHTSCRTGSLGYHLLSAEKVVRESSIDLTMNADETDTCSQLLKVALRDHGIPHRYEISSTTNGVVTWRTVKR